MRSCLHLTIAVPMMTAYPMKLAASGISPNAKKPRIAAKRTCE